VRAFEALRRGIELVYRHGQQTVPGAPDSDPTLGQMEKALRALSEQLDTME
jgi:hypothetical protein